jgi:hypothetical protein
MLSNETSMHTAVDNAEIATHKGRRDNFYSLCVLPRLFRGTEAKTEPIPRGKGTNLPKDRCEHPIYIHEQNEN